MKVNYYQDQCRWYKSIKVLQLPLFLLRFFKQHHYKWSITNYFSWKRWSHTCSVTLKFYLIKVKIWPVFTWYEVGNVLSPAPNAQQNTMFFDLGKINSMSTWSYQRQWLFFRLPAAMFVLLHRHISLTLSAPPLQQSATLLFMVGFLSFRQFKKNCLWNILLWNWYLIK